MGINDRFSKIKLRDDLNVIELPEVAAPSGNPSTDTGWLYVKDSSGTGKLYFENSAGTVTDLVATTNTAWDDISNPDANKTITFSTYTATFTGAHTAADGFTFENTANFGDISIVKIQQTTGNPTDGTVLEVISGDANVDALVVTASAINGLVVTGAGNVTMAGDCAITGTLTAGVLAINALAASAGTTLTLDGGGAGGVNICSTSTGGITLGDDAQVSSGKDLTLVDGTVSITNTGNEACFEVSASATTTNALDVIAGTTTGAALKITADDLGAAGSMIYLDSDNIAANNYYIRCYDGSANDFTVMANGITVITGTAAGTDALTITAGTFQITDGNIDMDEGKLEIDTTTDETSYIKRNQGTTTGPVVEFEETAAAADNAVLLIDQNATAAASYGIEIDSAGGTCLYISCEAAAGDGIVFSTPAAYTGQLIKVDDTLVGTNGEGIIDIRSTANMATGATLVRLDCDTGTLVGATNGFMLNIDDDSGAQATSYAVCINSASNEALYVQTGIASFAEQVVLTSGADIDGGLDIDFSANTEKISIESTVTDLAAGDAWVTIHGDHAGNTNDAALLRLVYQANGDAQDTFILCEDNSTGAAGNGDDMFKVGSGGLVTAAGGMSPGPTSTSIQYSTTVTLSNADIKALRASPKELVATPGAGKWLELDSVTLILNYGSEVLTESVDNLVVEYGTSGQDATAAIEATGFIDAGADQFIHIKGAGVTTGCALANVVNNNLRLFNTGDGEYGGNASNDTTMTAIVRYWVHDDTV